MVCDQSVRLHGRKEKLDRRLVRQTDLHQEIIKARE